MKGVKRTLLLWLLFSLSCQATDPPFAHDPNWFKTYKEAVRAQRKSGRSLLILFWVTPNRDTEKVEENLRRWKGIPSLLESYVRATLEVKENREVAALCKIFSAPSLAIIKQSQETEPSPRVMGTLETLENREAVQRFLETALLMNTLDPSSLFESENEGASPKQLLHRAEQALDVRNYSLAFENLHRAVQLLPSGTSEIHYKVYLKVADLDYQAGDFEEAIAYYRKALESSPKKEFSKNLVRILTRLALLLNDQGEHGEAIEVLDRVILHETDPEKLADLRKKRKAFEAGLYVLAGLGYPGVGLEMEEGGEGAVVSATQSSQHSREEQLKTAQRDLDSLQEALRKALDRKGTFPDYLEDLPEFQSKAKQIPTDPFSSSGQPYQYLHLEEPEGYILYSVGPDGIDQSGETLDSEGFEEGDIVRRYEESTE